MDAAPIIKPDRFISDLPLEDLPLGAVNDLNNMVSLDGAFIQAQPYQPVFGPALFKPRWLLPNQSSANAYWIYASDQNIGVTDGTNHFDITPLGGLGDGTAVLQPYTGGVVNGLPVVNSLIDGPYWWDQVTTNPMELLPDWPAGQVCESMRPFREFLIAMNIFTLGGRISDLLRWSDAAAPGDIPRSWTPDVDSQAGELSVSFNPGGLVDGKQLGDRFYVYKTNSTYVLQLIGGQFVFNNRPAFATVGMLSRSALIEWRGRHILMTDGDIVAHDGVNVESLVDRKQRRRIFDDLDGDNAGNSYLTLDISRSQIGIARPRVGEVYPSEVITLNLDDLRFGKRDVIVTGTPHVQEGIVPADQESIEPNWNQRTTTWATDPTRWNESGFLRTADFLVMADYDGSQLMREGLGSDFAGTPIESGVTRNGLSFGDSDRKKNVGKVWIKVNGARGGQIQLQFGAHDIETDTPIYGPAKTIIIGTTKFLDFDVTGYFIAYRFLASGQLPWKLVSMKVEVEFLGKY